MKLKVVAITETGDEVIHLFYNSGDNRDDIAGKPISMTEKVLVAVLQSPYTKTVLSLIMKECSAAISEQEPLCLHGDTVIMTDGGYGLVNHFRHDGMTSYLSSRIPTTSFMSKSRMARSSTAPGHPNKNDGADGTVQIMPNRKLS